MTQFKAGQTVQLEILNLESVSRTFKALQFTNKADKKALRGLVKAEIITMRNKAKSNLVAQGSVKTRALLKSFKVRSRSSKHTYSASLGSTSKYHFALDLGTGDRFTKTYPKRWTGAVGKATTNYKGRNCSFRLKYANKAINSVIPNIPGNLEKGISKVVNLIIMRNKL